MTDNEQDLKFDLEYSEKGVRILVRSVVEPELFDAYRLAKRLHRRIGEFDIQLELEERVEEAKSSISHIWDTKDERVYLSGEITDNKYRIALVVFRKYPECTSTKEIEDLSGVAQSTINDHLRGVTKSVAHYYTACKGGYILTVDGLHWLIEKVIPEILKNA